MSGFLRTAIAARCRSRTQGLTFFVSRSARDHGEDFMNQPPQGARTLIPGRTAWISIVLVTTADACATGSPARRRNTPKAAQAKGREQTAVRKRQGIFSKIARRRLDRSGARECSRTKGGNVLSVTCFTTSFMERRPCAEDRSIPSLGGQQARLLNLVHGMFRSRPHYQVSGYD